MHVAASAIATAIITAAFTTSGLLLLLCNIPDNKLPQSVTIVAQGTKLETINIEKIEQELHRRSFFNVTIVPKFNYS